jgi:Fe-S oxidoreductase
MDQWEFESATPGGLIWLLRGNLEGIVPMNKKTLEQLYSCTLCKACEFQCYGDHAEHITEIFLAVREKQVEEGNIPAKVKDFLENILKHGNPWGEARSKRGEWAKAIEGVSKYKFDDEFLYYVGCEGSYDTFGQRMAQNLAELLVKAGVSFGILGEEELCSGNDVRLLGERGLFEMLVEKNMKTFKDLGVKKIVTLSPHDYNAFKNMYPEYGDMPEVIHYTQLLHELIKNGKIKLSSFNAKVTYHDPCFLGRYNNIYDEPREILKSIPGIELVEMKRNKENALCCGGGCGNFYFGFLNSKARIREAYNTGAEILAVACPSCGTMLESASKENGLEDKILIMSIPEIVKKTLLSGT